MRLVIYGLIIVLAVEGFVLFVVPYLSGSGGVKIAEQLDQYTEKHGPCDKLYPLSQLQAKTGLTFQTIANGGLGTSQQCIYKANAHVGGFSNITVKIDYDPDKSVLAKTKDYYRPDFSKYEATPEFGSEAVLANQPVMNNYGDTTNYALIVYKNGKTYSVETAEFKSPDQTKDLVKDIMLHITSDS